MDTLELAAGTLPAVDKPNLVAFLAGPPTLPLTSHAPQFGLASLIPGAVVFLAAPVVLVPVTQLVANGRGSPTDAEIRAWLGVRGLQRHRVEGGSYALPLAGLVLSAMRRSRMGSRHLRRAVDGGEHAVVTAAHVFQYVHPAARTAE